MYLDFKISAWERVFVPKELEEEVLKSLKDGQIQTSNDIINHFEGTERKDLFGIETLVPHENDGQCTIEFIEDGEDREPIFVNA
jgi:hypothetical protein